MSETKLIVGLGNPGRQYELTRHNLGFLAVRRLAEIYRLKFGLSSFTNGLSAEGQINECDVCLLLPLTYMNNSGIAVEQAIDHKGLDHSDVLILCDDMNLDFGAMRLRPSGSDGGNNGLKSIIARLQSREFARLRLGIGKPENKDENIDYVLAKFTKNEQKVLDDFIEKAVQCCTVWLKEGVAKAMDQFNKRNENG